MSAVLEMVVLAFASVGLFALGHWIFRRGWQVHWKVIGILFVVSLWWAMINGPLKGHFGADHGALTGILATFGIVMAVALAIRRFAQGWQPWAITGAAVVLLLLIWIPRFNASQSAQSAAQAAQSSAKSLAPSQHSGPVSSAPNGHPRLNCGSLSPEGKQAAGCP